MSLCRQVTLFPLLFSLLAPLAPAQQAPAAQQATLHANSHHKGVQHLRRASGLQPSTEIYAAFHGHLAQVASGAQGAAWLVLSAEYAGASESSGPKSLRQSVQLRIPLSSTAEAYGESRSCSLRPGHNPLLTFTAGLDETSFVAFRSSGKDQDFRFLLNKYLCRALAAPFHCGSTEVRLSRDWSNWRLARSSSIELESDKPADFRVSPLRIDPTAEPFDFARCAVVAPSDGLCCVDHKSTQWHCGGTPVGSGWHQVSGDCFHREIGGSCTD